MLLVSDILQNKEAYIAGLEKRNIKDATSLLDTVIELDKRRKKTQQELDTNLLEAKKIAKAIGAA